MVLAIQRGAASIWLRGTAIREGGFQFERPISIGREGHS
jgi:hypothetical protein